MTVEELNAHKEIEVLVSDLLRIIANKVSFVQSYKTMNKQRGQILAVAVHDLINLASSKEIQKVTCIMKQEQE